MATEIILKDLGDAFTRLFDHHPVIQGEINYTLSEFEVKHGDAESIKLQKILEYSREIHEKLIPESQKMMDEHMPSILQALNETKDCSRSILDKEGSSQKDDWLLDRRSERVDKWTAFMDEMCDASEKVDKDHEAEVQRVKKYYEDVETHLKINKRC